MGAAEYINHLYNKDLDGYIQVLQLSNGKAIKVLNTEIKGLVDIVEQQEGQEDTFISPNSFYIPKRANSNIRQFRALYIDLDLKEYSKTEAFYEIIFKVGRNEIPKPTMIVDSGRGLHCYWRIEHAPMGAKHTWQELQDYLYKQLKPLGADLQATDAARVLRLPGTINSRNNGACEVLEDNENMYSMYDLREKYLNYKEKAEFKPKIKSNKKVKNLFNSYTLHLARAEDIETIARLRSYKVTGYRNALTHLYSYWKGIYIRDNEDLLEVVEDFNDKFSQPLKDSTIQSVVKSTTKAVERFIDYEQGIRSGEAKRVSKAMQDRGGYWYKNDTLIELLDITQEEQRQLKTIICKSEKLRRKNEVRKKDRRNEEGLTQREQQKKDNIKAVNELAAEGLTQSQIAKELELTRARISQILNYEI